MTISYAKVLAELGPTRDSVLADFRGRGGDRDRWSRVDRDAMAHALTCAEDQLEMAASRKAENLAARFSVQRARRAIEQEMT